MRMNHMDQERQLQKRIALVAHDHKKQDLLEWARYNRLTLVQHEIFATGTTGALLERELEIHVNKLQSGPLGGDQQIGAKIAEGEIDFLIFFWDPLRAQPHDPDVKALLRIAVVWNIPVACNRTTADFMISSPLMIAAYQRLAPDYGDYLQRNIVAEPVNGMEDATTLDETTIDNLAEIISPGLQAETAEDTTPHVTYDILTSNLEEAEQAKP